MKSVSSWAFRLRVAQGLEAIHSEEPASSPFDAGGTMTTATKSTLPALLVFSCLMVFPLRSAAQESAGSTVVTAAGEQYRAGVFHRWILGRHYRDLWTTPIEVDVLDLSTYAGGLTPLRRGGGRQTRSLRFLGADGREHSFRSVDKDPSAVIDSILRGTVVDDLVQDGISAAHPFGALVAAPLLAAAGVLHVDPVLRVMPDDPALGEFRAEFAGMLGLIEERPDENEGDRTAFEGTVRVIGHERLTERIDEGPADRVDARAFLTARVMDIFLGDWDRHRGQWRWATYDDAVADERFWLPVPTDRDQAFSKFDGIVPRTMSLFMPQFVRFEADYPNVERLHWNGRALDRQYLAGLERPVWDSIAASVQASLTDDVIEEAVDRLPPEIFAINGAELIGALKARRDNLTIPVENLYEVLAKKVDLYATDASESVVVDRTDPDFVTISLADSESADEPYLQRRFTEDETNEIRIYLKGGDDQISVFGDGGGAITIRVMGGPGDDAFEVNDSRDRVRIYDWQGNNTVSGFDAPGLDTKEFDEWVWSEEDRDQPRDWGSGLQPIFWTSYSTDLGLLLGGGVRLERYGFRKTPFSSGIDFKGAFSFTRQKGRAEIDGRLNRANSPVFTTFRLRYSALDVLHFFGFGNDTQSTDEDFFKVDQRAASFAAAVGVGGDSGFELTAGLVASRSNSDENANRFFGTVRDTLYGAGVFWQAGATASLVYDAPVDPLKSANRLRIDLRGATFPAIFDVTTPFTKVGAVLSTVLSPSVTSRVSLALLAGGEKVWGDDIPWNDAAFAGGAESIRGWAEQRFAGDAAVYGAGELRLRVWNPRVVVPVAIGIFGFVDAGRVYVDGASPGGWHTGVGGGIYFKPIAQPYMLRAGAGVSDETTKIYILLGLPY